MSASLEIPTPRQYARAVDAASRLAALKATPEFESKHPRDDDGKFAEGAGGGSEGKVDEDVDKLRRKYDSKTKLDGYRNRLPPAKIGPKTRWETVEGHDTQRAIIAGRNVFMRQDESPRAAFERSLQGDRWYAIPEVKQAVDEAEAEWQRTASPEAKAKKEAAAKKRADARAAKEAEKWKKAEAERIAKKEAERLARERDEPARLERERIAKEKAEAEAKAERTRRHEESMREEAAQKKRVEESRSKDPRDILGSGMADLALKVAPEAAAQVYHNPGEYGTIASWVYGLLRWPADTDKAVAKDAIRRLLEANPPDVAEGHRRLREQRRAEEKARMERDKNLPRASDRQVNAIENMLGRLEKIDLFDSTFGSGPEHARKFRAEIERGISGRRASELIDQIGGLIEDEM